MAGKFLDKVYKVGTAKDMQKLYGAWSGSYDSEVQAEGYATPRRCAKALKTYLADAAAPILDYGCGTGLSGVALNKAGATTIDGMDVSKEMLAQAAEKGVYRTLHQIDPDAPPAISPGDYAAITAVGAIGTGAAPLSTFDLLVGWLGRGGLFCFSFNDHALEIGYEGRLNEYVDCGSVRLLHRKYGPHLPGKNLKAMVYVIEKI